MATAAYASRCVLGIACISVWTSSAQISQPIPSAPALGLQTIEALVEALEQSPFKLVERDRQGRVFKLYLARQWCNDQNLALVAHLPDLRELSLQGGRTNKVTSEGLRLLRANTNLCFLSFACFFTNLPAGMLSEVATFPQIKEVQLIGAEPASSEYAALASKANLVDFQIHYGWGFGEPDLAIFTNAPRLKHLVVDSKGLPQTCAELLPSFPALTNAVLHGWTDRTSWKTNWSALPRRTDKL